MTLPPSDQPGSPVPAPDTTPGPTAGPLSTIELQRGFTLSYIFWGAEGLRAGWAILLFLVLQSAFVITAATTLRGSVAFRLDKDGWIGPQGVFIREALSLFSVVFATWLMAKIERRPVAAYGYARLRAVPNFVSGLVWGVALLSLLVMLLRAAGLLVFDGDLLSGGAAVRYGLIWFVGFLLVACFEESYSRGYLQFTLTRGLRAIYRAFSADKRAVAFAFWTAALILSFGFGFGHRSNPGESPLGLLTAGLAGLLFCLSLWRTGSLWWAIGFHATWDWAQSYLYGVADSGLMVQGHLLATHPVGSPILSGGLTGPEGSVYLYPVLALGAAVLWFTVPATHSGYLPANAPAISLD